MLINIILLIVGGLAASTAVIMINMSAMHPALLASYRLLVAAAFLSPVYVRHVRRHREKYEARHLKASLLPGIVLGLHFISWIIGARMTTAANATLIVNMMPVAMPFLLYLMIKERITRQELLGTGLAMVGVLALSIGDFNITPEYFWGDVVCFLSMLCFTYYLALGRKNRTMPSMWLYLVPLYFAAGLFCFLVALALTNPIQAYPAREIGLVLGLGIIPTIVGHSLLNYAMKHIRGQVVSIVNILVQSLGASVIAYFLFGEVPSLTFAIAGLFMLGGVWVVVRQGDLS